MLECTSHAQCPTSLSCLNGRCQNPCASHFCSPNQACRVLLHQPVCHDGKVFLLCGFKIVHQCPMMPLYSRCYTESPGCEHCPPGVPCDPLTGACIKGRMMECGRCVFCRSCGPAEMTNVLLFCRCFVLLICCELVFSVFLRIKKLTFVGRIFSTHDNLGRLICATNCVMRCLKTNPSFRKLYPNFPQR